MAAEPFENTAALPPTASLPRSFVSAEMLFVTLGPSARLIVTDVSDAAVTSPRSKLNESAAPSALMNFTSAWTAPHQALLGLQPLPESRALAVAQAECSSLVAARGEDGERRATA